VLGRKYEGSCGFCALVAGRDAGATAGSIGIHAGADFQIRSSVRDEIKQAPAWF
jgi:hypothetical protein